MPPLACAALILETATGCTLRAGHSPLAVGMNEGPRLRFEPRVEVVIRIDAREVICAADPAVPEDALRFIVVDHVLPLVLALQGRCAFHAAAVGSPRGAVLLVGPSGVGKSTLAVALARTPGFAFLADDCVLLEDGRVRAIHADAGLHPDARTALGLPDRQPGKRLYSPPVTASSDALHRAYVLSAGESVRIEPADPRLLRPALVAAQASTRQYLGPVALPPLPAVDTRTLVLPRDLSRLEDVVDCIIRDLE